MKTVEEIKVKLLRNQQILLKNKSFLEQRILDTHGTKAKNIIDEALYLVSGQILATKEMLDWIGE